MPIEPSRPISALTAVRLVLVFLLVVWIFVRLNRKRYHPALTLVITGVAYLGVIEAGTDAQWKQPKRLWHFASAR
jgi:hypothetical protein